MRTCNLKLCVCMLAVFSLAINILSCNYCEAQGTAEIAKAITPEAGVLASSWTGKSGKAILILQENHISRVGQVELALMLTRLYNLHHVKVAAVEGAFVNDGVLDAKWFHRLPDTDAREEAALQLLRTGEISAAEFMALAVPEVKVYGVEKEEEHTFGMLPSSEAAPIVYMFAIAEKLFPKDESRIGRANKLAEEVERAPEEKKAEKAKELMDYMINANEWTRTRYEKLKTETTVVSIDEILVLLEEIEAKAKEVKADVAEYKDAFRNLLEFYKRAEKRTDTIIMNALKLDGDSAAVSLLPVIMGAAHTKGACAILEKEDISYAVVSPLSLGVSKPICDLSPDALERKRDKQSVDDINDLGSFLDGRWKPSPTIGQTWLRSESELYYVCNLLAKAVANGEKPPFENLKTNLADLRYTKIDAGSFEVIGDEAIFKVIAETKQANQPAILWARVRMMEPEKRVSLEQRLKEILLELRQEGLKIEEKTGRLFSIGLECQRDLDNKKIPTDMQAEFQKAGISLPLDATVLVESAGRWFLTHKHEIFRVTKAEKEGKLDVSAVLKVTKTSRNIIAVFSEKPEIIRKVSLTG